MSLNQTLYLDGAPESVRQFYNNVPFPADVMVYFLHISISGVLLVAMLFGIGFSLFWVVTSVYGFVQGRRVEWGVASIALTIGIGLALGFYAVSSGITITYGGST